jgi:DNA-binding CsgD family transcriptional regulator
VTVASPRGWAALVERDAERGVIGGALSEMERGHGCVVLLYGQSGVGRSSVLDAVVADAETRGLSVLTACGRELERGYSFGIVRQLLEARVARLTAAQRRSMLSEAGPAAAAAIGVGAFETFEAGASGTGFEQIQGVYQVLSRLAAMKPLLIAVDDVQWCDRSSLDFLCFLGHRATRLPIALIAAWRRGEPGARAGQLQALAGDPDNVFLTLAPLSNDGIRAIVERATGDEPDDDVVSVIAALTGGQPFLVNELIQGMRLRGISGAAGSCEAVKLVVPESVRRNAVARLGRHPESVRRFAEAVAVLREASLRQAAALAEIDDRKARGVADALVRAGLLRDAAVLEYAQPLVRAAVYGTLSSLECADLHCRAATLLCEAGVGSDPSELGRIAQHLLRSQPAGNLRFGEVLRSVAADALGRGALAFAMSLLVRALGEISDPATRLDVLVRLSELELRLDSLDAAATHASEARALASTPVERVRASLAYAHAVAATTGCAAAAELLEVEAQRLGRGATQLKLRLRAEASLFPLCANEPPRPPIRLLGSTHGRGGDGIAARAALAAEAAGLTLAGGGDAARVAELCSRALAQAGGQQDGDQSDTATYFGCRAAIEADMGGVVEAILARARSSNGAAGHGDTKVVCMALRSQLALAGGALADAGREADAALALLDECSPTPLRRRLRADLLSATVLVAIERCRLDDAEAALGQLMDGGDAPSFAVASLRVALALARSAPEDAHAIVADFQEDPPGIAAPGICWQPWAALAHHAAGDVANAVACASSHLERMRVWNGQALLGRALVVRGVVEPRAARMRFLEEAVGVLEKTPCSLELARALIELGSALRRAGSRADARDRLIRGADLAHHCDAHALCARARAELVSLGARPRRGAFSGISSLTVSELRVARLAAAGMTSRAIASHLTVSAKTVSAQLSAAYRKLDVHDRGALAAVIQSASERDRSAAEPSRELIGQP